MITLVRAVRNLAIPIRRVVANGRANIIRKLYLLVNICKRNLSRTGFQFVISAVHAVSRTTLDRSRWQYRLRDCTDLSQSLRPIPFIEATSSQKMYHFTNRYIDRKRMNPNVLLSQECHRPWLSNGTEMEFR
jgi:hypothetical protein